MFLKIKAFPNSKKEEVLETGENSFSVFVREKAEKNEANKRILQILRFMFKDKKIIKIIAGHKFDHKIVEILD